MLPLRDPQIRLALFHYVAARPAGAQLRELRAAGIEHEQLEVLRRLSPPDLARLAAMRELTIGVAFDAARLKEGLRALALVNEAKALEAYFIRHGASYRLMRTLFKVRRKVTYRRRRESGAWRPAGRMHLPTYATRERIYRTWRGIQDPSPRLRYYRLHQAFQHYAIAALESIIREFEVRR